MHELGVVIQVVKQVEAFAEEQGVADIEELVLQVGELSSMVPAYIEQVYPIAVENSVLKNTKLRIETSPGLVRCKDCGFGFNVVQNDHQCPRCRSKEWEVISGTEFMIKEILVR